MKIQISFSSKLFAIATFILVQSFTVNAQSNGTCSGALPICADGGHVYTANSGTTIEDGNNYGCLTTQPNPSWFYLEATSYGIVELTFSASEDIAVIFYGPFDEISELVFNCDNLGGVQYPIAECTGAPSPSENFTLHIEGNYYVVLVTNHAPTSQTFTVTMVDGAAAIDCSNVPNPECWPDVGTHQIKKNGVLKTSPLTLFLNDTLELISNGDYLLPGNTIPQPDGDGVYSAQHMWLLYTYDPMVYDPDSDPAFVEILSPSDYYMDINNDTSDVVENYGCGNTVWYVPVVGDDGIGGNGNVDNGINDNGNLDWDKNGDDCFEIGKGIQVTYHCMLNTEEIKMVQPSIYFSEGYLHTESQEELLLNFYDLSGKILQSTFCHEGTTSIPLNLYDGCYLVQILSKTSGEVIGSKNLVVIN